MTPAPDGPGQPRGPDSTETPVTSGVLASDTATGKFDIARVESPSSLFLDGGT